MTESDLKINRIFTALNSEFHRASQLHPAYLCHHQASAIIREEFEEYWDEVKKRGEKRDHQAMNRELLKIATTAIRAIHDLNDTFELRALVEKGCASC